MSSKASNAVMALKELGGRPAKIVLWALADRIGDDLRCFPSLNKLCADTGMDRRKVQRLLKQLEDEGYIERVKRTHMSGRQRSNSYLLHIPGFEAETGEGVKSDTLPQKAGENNTKFDAPEGVKFDTGEGVKSDAPVSLNPHIEPPELTNTPLTPQGDGLGVMSFALCQIVGGLLVEPSAQFQAFEKEWAAHAPANRWHRLKAARAWNAAVQAGAEPIEILAGVRWSVAIATAREARYVPAVAKWLANAEWQSQVAVGERDGLPAWCADERKAAAENAVADAEACGL